MVTYKELIFTTVWLGDGNLLGIGNLQGTDLYDSLT